MLCCNQIRTRAALARIATLPLVLLGLGHNSLAQQPPRPVLASATLPESNEAMLLSSQVENAIERGDFRLAIRLIEQIMQLPPGLVAAPGSQTLYPVHTQAVWLLRRLPPEGAQIFRELHDAEAAGRFDEARAGSDVPVLRELFREYPISAIWPDIGRELVGLLLDRGQYGEAIEVIRELATGGAPDVPERRAQLAAALLSIGARGAAEQLLGALERESEKAPGTPLAKRTAALREWMVRGGGPAVAAGQHAFKPQLHAGDAWNQTLFGASLSPGGDASGGLPRSSEVFRAWPLHRAVLTDDTLVVRVGGRLSVFDALTLAPLWSVPEIATEQTGDASDRWQPMLRQVQLGPAGELSAMSQELNLLLSHALRHSVAAGAGRVYTIESLQLVDDGTRGFQRRGFGFDDSSVLFANQLIARELRTGVDLWRAGAEPGDPLTGAAFQAAPLLLGDALVVPVQRGAALQLCVLDPVSGKLRREVPLIGPPTEFPFNGGRCFVVADETTLYVATGNGIVCALGREDYDWHWATIYPSTIGERLGMQWWQPRVTSPGDEYIIAPVLADDLLVLAPVDSRDLFALDRFSGVERWRRPLGEDRFVIGAVESGLLLAGSRIYCVEAADGRTLRWQSVPLEITGAPALRSGRVHVPTQTGLIVIDARNGKVVDDQTANVLSPPVVPSLALANLLVSDDSLFSVSPTTVVKFPDPAVLTERCDDLLAKSPGDPRPQLARAWVSLLTGALPDALKSLEQLKPADAGLAAARDRLLGEVLLALALGSADEAERLGWLRRAAELANSPDVMLRVASMMGKTFEDAGRWGDALTHYAGFVRSPPPGLRHDPDDRALRQASWVFSIERFRACLERASETERHAVVARLIDEAVSAGDAATLRRVRALSADEAQRTRIDAAFTLASPPPELAIETLPAIDPPDFTEPDARRLQLERCAVYIYLGRTADARAALQDWQTRFGKPGAAEPTQATDDPKERERVEYLDLAIQKIAQTELPPFEPPLRRQWRVLDTELALDARAADKAMRSWFVARTTVEPKTLLMRAFDGSSLRTWPAAVAAEGAVAPEPSPDFVEPGSQEGEPLRVAWPLTTHRDLGAMPSAGGVVCVGLGPERQGGQQLWSFPVPDWETPPAEFSDRSIGGPWGLFFCPRGGRVVLLDWLTGEVRWQRDLAGRTVARLHIAAGALLVVTDDQQIVALDPEFGRELRVLPPISGTTREVRVVGDTVLLLGEAAIVGVSAATFEKRWTEPCGGVSGFVRVVGRDWFAYRDRTSERWRVRNASDGRKALESELSETGEFDAMFASEDTLLTAAHRAGGGSENAPEAVAVTAYRLPAATQLWNQVLPTSVALNVTQLAAHPRYIPVLIADAPDRGDDDSPRPSIRMIDKQSGEALEAVSTGPITRKNATCRMALFVTPSRMIIQAYGNLLGFGNAAGATR